MLEDRDTEEFKKTMKRLQEDYQLELELENERVEDIENEEETDERVDDAESEEHQ